MVNNMSFFYNLLPNAFVAKSFQNLNA